MCMYTENQSKKNELCSYLLANYKPGNKWKEIGEQFGFEAETARRIWLNYRKKNNISDGDLVQVETRTYTFPLDYKEPTFSQIGLHSQPQKITVTEVKEDIETGHGEISLSSPTEIKKLEDLQRMIDNDRWEISKYVQNYWSGKYQVKARVKPKTLKEAELVKHIIENYKSNWKRIENADKLININWGEESLLLINLNDLHLDKKDIENSTIEKNIENYFKVLEYLIGKAYVQTRVDKICFVVGNDLFNTDNIHNTTTNGTPQSCNTTWCDAYEKVFDAMVQSIGMLSRFSENGVHVILVQGNHDRTKSYYLAHALETFFKNDTSITFDRTDKLNKSIVYGNTFIGFNHGNNINDKLPLAFAKEFARSWGECKYHDIIISDKHHNNEKTFKMQTQNEFQGVKLRILPSLSRADRGNDDNLFRARQSGIALNRLSSCHLSAL